jgi:hypothetical protein
MKYISLVVVLALMIWSWSLATAEPSFTADQTRRVEEGVENDIHAFIQRKFPQTTDIYCQQLYTETVKANEQMNGRFRCSTEGGASNNEKIQQTFEGVLRLASKDGFETWDEVGGEIRVPDIVFENGSKISAKDAVDETPEKTVEPAEPTEAPTVTHEHE